MKTEKYGRRIIELMRSHVMDARAGNGADANKRSKKDKDVVFDSLWRVAAKNNIGQGLFGILSASLLSWGWLFPVAAYNTHNAYLVG